MNSLDLQSSGMSFFTSAHDCEARVGLPDCIGWQYACHDTGLGEHLDVTRHVMFWNVVRLPDGRCHNFVVNVHETYHTDEPCDVLGREEDPYDGVEELWAYQRILNGPPPPYPPVPPPDPPPVPEVVTSCAVHAAPSWPCEPVEPTTVYLSECHNGHVDIIRVDTMGLADNLMGHCHRLEVTTRQRVHTGKRCRPGEPVTLLPPIAAREWARGLPRSDRGTGAMLPPIGEVGGASAALSPTLRRMGALRDSTPTPTPDARPISIVAINGQAATIESLREARRARSSVFSLRVHGSRQLGRLTVRWDRPTARRLIGERGGEVEPPRARRDWGPLLPGRLAGGGPFGTTMELGEPDDDAGGGGQ